MKVWIMVLFFIKPTNMALRVFGMVELGEYDELFYNSSVENTAR